MRETKFRAWDKDKKCLKTSGLMTLTGHLFQVGRDGFNDQYPDYDLMQYTGLKDKNGKEIYEGDVVSIEGEKTVVVTQVYVDSVNPHGAGDFLAWNIPSPDLYCEVIGNVYENPKLVTEK